MHRRDALILDIAGSRREATDAELTEIATHVATRGFGPDAITKLGPRGAGATWQGRTYVSNERISNELAHFLRHVVAKRQWPLDTTLDEYIESLRQMVRDPDAGVHLSRVGSAWAVNVFALSRQWRGPEGAAYTVVGYPLDHGWWSTGFQIDSPFTHIAQQPRWQDGRWLRFPKPLAE